MANLHYKNETIKLDNAAGTLTDITAYLTSESMAGVQELMDNTTMSLEERVNLPGLAGGSASLAGMVNSTTHAILAPLIGNRTTVTKTLQRQATSNLVTRGEFWVTDVEFSGSVNTMQTFSASLTLDGPLTSTSVAL